MPKTGQKSNPVKGQEKESILNFKKIETSEAKYGKLRQECYDIYLQKRVRATLFMCFRKIRKF